MNTLVKQETQAAGRDLRSILTKGEIFEMGDIVERLPEHHSSYVRLAVWWLVSRKEIGFTEDFKFVYG